MTDTHERIWRKVREANAAWTGGRPEEVAPLFHPDVMMLSPSGDVLVEGRDAMVTSFVEYCRVAVTRRFEEKEPEVRVFGDTAVVAYDFEVEYELDGEGFAEAGREVLVLARGAEDWAVVCRQQLACDPET